ncbi:putative general secretion pathway protein I [Magnetofaba australis IT-1]|uniref:Type II secretion system protein I n=1 Tax=Magnetofaba australis IT-1 TaxID=1434232 RepID=A0A1Y2K709_9PROT|nr:putative general secretion pathway protein I [Magnetofaba australis IT-1]
MLVALAVLAIAMGATMKAASVFAQNAAHMRERTLAHWVAMNQAAEHQARREWLAPGRYNGKEEMGGRVWYWTIEVSGTPINAIRRMDIAVRRVEDRKATPVATLEAYLARRTS